MNGVDIARVHETIELGARGVPLLIGKGGATIKELQAKCGARIDVPRGGTACTVSGSADDVARAVATVKALLEDNGHGETLDLDCHVGVLLGKAGATIRKIQEASGCAGSLEQIAAAKREIQGAVDAANAGPRSGPARSQAVAVPGSVGAVIGKAGANVKKIQDESKAKIDVKDGCCVVYGPPDAVAAGAAAIRAIVGKQADFDAQRAAARRRPASAQSSCARRRLAVDDYDYVDAYDEFQEAVEDSIDCGAGTILLEEDVTVAAQVEIYDGAAVTIAGRECAWDQKFGDGTCDAENNVADCLYDGGDCCVATCAGDGCPTTDADCDDDAPGDGDFLIPGSWSRALDGGGHGDKLDGGTQILWVSDAGTTLTLRHLVLYGGTCIKGACATYSDDDDDGGGAALSSRQRAVLDDGS
ncbi:RNA binding-protein [Aureococcus anophagefferens]|nr:RNA binding-protein [Aureococcus anophagefferens]